MSVAEAVTEPTTEKEATKQQLRDWPHRYEVVPIDKIIIDETYQRELTSLADEIAEDPDPAMVGTVIGSERANGKVALVDGQTRFRGLQKAGWTELPALVYEGMTKADEAALFARLQRKRRNIATYQRFRAALVAGDKEANVIQKILKKHDLAVGAKGDNKVQAVAALEAVYRRDPILLDNVFGVLVRAWGTENVRDAFSADMIRGVARLMSSQKVDVERLVARLGNTSPGKLQVRAGMLREGRGGGGHTSAYMADALLTEYSRRG
jgi:hypothetical protein